MLAVLAFCFSLAPRDRERARHVRAIRSALGRGSRSAHRFLRPDGLALARRLTSSRK
jgi:hypothetical protein